MKTNSSKNVNEINPQPNLSIEYLAKVLNEAYELKSLPNSIIVFVVQPGEKNVSNNIKAFKYFYIILNR